MRKVTLIFALMLCTACAFGQRVPEGELFGGYSFSSADIGRRVNLSGFEGTVNGNFNRWIGFTFDYASQYGTPTINGTPVKTHNQQVLFGPRITYRDNLLTPYAHFLVGIAYTRLEIPGGAFAKDRGAALGGGGGFDVSLSKQWAFRTQGDLLRTNIGNSWQNNIRISTGIVFKFGRR